MRIVSNYSAFGKRNRFLAPVKHCRVGGYENARLFASCQSPVECASGAMNAQQLGGSDWSASVLFNENTQFFACGRCSLVPHQRLYERPPGVLVLAEETRFAHALARHHDEGHLQQRE